MFLKAWNHDLRDTLLHTKENTKIDVIPRGPFKNQDLQMLGLNSTTISNFHLLKVVGRGNEPQYQNIFLFWSPYPSISMRNIIK